MVPPTDNGRPVPVSDITVCLPYCSDESEQARQAVNDIYGRFT